MLARDLATGTLTYTTNLIKSLQGEGVEVVVGYGGSDPPPLPCRSVLLDAGIPRAVNASHITQVYRPLVNAMRLRKQMRGFRPDVVFAQGTDELAVAAVIAARVYHRPAVTFIHDLTLREFQLAAQHNRITPLLLALSLIRQKIVVKHLSRIIVSSRFMKTSLEKRFAVSPAITPLGVSQEFRPRSRTGDEHPFRLIFVGNLVTKKMPQTAVRALIYLGDLDVRLAIVGEGPLAESLRALCRELNLTERVYFKGRLNSKDLALEMSASHVCVVPSMWEGFSLVALEAMASGVPVIASSGGALNEIVKHGNNGFLFSPGDPEELATNIRTLIENKGLWNAMVDNCTQMAREYRWEKTAIGTIQVIQQVLSRN